MTSSVRGLRDFPWFASLVFMSLGIGLSACAQQAKVIDESVFSKMSATSTRADVYELLGAPTFRQDRGDEGRIFGYIRRCPEGQPEVCPAAPSGAPWQHCEFQFDKGDHFQSSSCRWSPAP